MDTATTQHAKGPLQPRIAAHQTASTDTITIEGNRISPDSLTITSYDKPLRSMRETFFRDQQPSQHDNAVDNIAVHIPTPRQRSHAAFAHGHHSRKYTSGRDTPAICHILGPSIQLLSSRHTHPATLTQGCGIRYRHFSHLCGVRPPIITVINTNTHLSTFNAFYTIAFPK